MKPIFVKNWHGIPLKSVEGFNGKKIPEADFYTGFYEKFFDAHQNWEDLKSDWVDHKINCAKFIKGRLVGMKRVLSVGCGIGIIEKYLLDSGVEGLEIQEVSKAPLRWVHSLFQKEAIHIGRLPECLGLARKYDYIFLSIVDYNFEAEELIRFLRKIRERLNPMGRCLIVTPNIQLASYKFYEISYEIKMVIKKIFAFIGFYDLGQMVGWRRSMREFQNAMTSAGFNAREEGFLDKDAMFRHTYWIEGKNLG